MNELIITLINSQISHILFLKSICGASKTNTIISSVNSIFNFFLIGATTSYYKGEFNMVTMESNVRYYNIEWIDVTNKNNSKYVCGTKV